MNITYSCDMMTYQSAIIIMSLLTVESTESQIKFYIMYGISVKLSTFHDKNQYT